MNEDIQKIIDAIKINVEIAKVNGKPIIAEVTMNESSKKYISDLIENYGDSCYNKGLLKSKR